ncbi:unnamed protein product [Soboliphyme baturini]|uniref:Protein CASP n=1 Tax=Soboliphyme baturini TaxID=241478 RepID=A0A183IRL0_9BILA|nr:unnamed protein product [Soboliphyme baturini]
MEATIHRLRSENAQLHRRLRTLQQQDNNNGQSTTANATNGVDGGLQVDSNFNGVAEQPSTATMTTKMHELQLELAETKKMLASLKLDRKRLKSEKLELLSQMKDVYQTLEAKEKELRDFIRQFEVKMRDSDRGIQKVLSSVVVLFSFVYCCRFEVVLFQDSNTCCPVLSFTFLSCGIFHGSLVFTDFRVPLAYFLSNTPL